MLIKGKLEFLLTTFAVILMPMALPIIARVEFNFEVVMYIYHVCFLSPKSFSLKLAICIQNLLESAPIVVFSWQL